MNRWSNALNIKLDCCIVWIAHNTVFGRKQSAICAQAVYFLHSMMPSVTCLRLSDVSVICCVTYFQFPIQSAFLLCRLARQHSGVLGLPNIGHWTVPKIYVHFLYGAYNPGEWFWIDSNSKNGNHNPIKGSFGREFPVICYHCVVMAAWSRKMLKFCEKCLHLFLENDPLH